MKDTDILELLEDIGRSSTARLSPAVSLFGETAHERRQRILQTIRGTILPRRLELTAANGDFLAIEVNSSRITDVFRTSAGPVPDFETEPRAELTSKLARLVSDLSLPAGPLELVSKRPDSTLEADDVGITFSEFETACRQIELPEEPQMSIVASTDDEPDPKEDTPSDAGLAEQFYDGAGQFAQGRVLFDGQGASEPQFDGLCAPDRPAHPDDTLLTRFTRDLARWDEDSSLSQPQMIVLRPSGGRGMGLALLRDGHHSATALHDARKLGAVVNLWKSLRDAAE
ncbi:hypothetical protein [Ruegeria sp.]|uniref:hypothetical protein n=1 Tax=Ruegeria sp. TaxID=1879320 RepID=UPI003C7E06D4